jgi:RNA-directed DNA polymerase
MKRMTRHEKWKEIQWKKIHLYVYDLQHKIYCHAKDCKISLVRHFEHKLIKSIEARLLSVRMVSQDNRGKVTTGVDKISNLSPRDRLRLTERLVLNGKASPIRRVFIPKSDGSLRSLGIPTIKDRAKQKLHHTLDKERKRTGEIKFVHSHCHDRIHLTK